MTSRYEELLLPEQRDKTIDRVVRALKSNNQLSTRTLNKFRKVLRVGRPIPGFNKDPIKAPPPALKQCMTESIERNADFAHLLVEVWAETEPQLRDAVSEHLDSLDAEAYEGDEIDEEFWDEQVKLLAAAHDAYDEYDILLMVKVCYSHAKLEARLNEAQEEGEASGDEASVIVMETASSVLSDVLDRLRMLPAESQAWHEDIPRFADALNSLMSAKEEERNQFSRMLEDFEELQDAFASELEFFGRQAADWGIDRLGINRLGTSAAITEAAQKFSDLETALANYRAVTERADTIAEERERREQRHDLEDAIERMLSEIDDLAQNTDTPDDDPPTGAPAHRELPPTSEAGHSTDTAPEYQPQSQPEADLDLQDELRALRGEYDALLSSSRALKQDNDATRETNRALEGEVSGLNADKQTLAEEVAELKDQLRISELQELNWRNAYEAEKSKDSSTPEPIPSEVESIKQALEIAKERYDDKLLFHLNNKSDPDYNYNRPKEVWDALEWLATIYHQTQTGEARVMDLNQSIRDICSRWEYKANQTDITVNTYPEWYTTIVDGTTHELRKHIGKGISRRDSNIIRIAFAWDDETERVVVGYIGPHQRNRKS